MAFRRISRFRLGTSARKQSKSIEQEPAEVGEQSTTPSSPTRLRTTVGEPDAAVANETLSASRNLPDAGTADPPTRSGDTSSNPDALKRAVTDAAAGAAPDLGAPSDGIVDDPATAPTGRGPSPSVGTDVLGSVGPDVSPSFDPRPGSVDAATGAATTRTGLDPGTKTPDEVAHLRPDAAGSTGFVEVVDVGPEPSEPDPGEKAERNLLGELGFTDAEIDLAFSDPDAFTELVNERADRAFLAEHGFSEREIDAALNDRDAFIASMDEAAQKALIGREDSPLDLEAEEAIVRGVDIATQMQMARDALVAAGYSEAEADELTAPPRGGWVLNDFKPKPELEQALAEIGSELASEETEIVADEQEAVSDEKEIVSDEKEARGEAKDDGPVETVFVGGGAEDRGDQRIVREDEKAETEEEEQQEGEEATQAGETKSEEEKETAGSEAEAASRPDTEATDPRIEKQARDLEAQLGAGSRDPRSGAVDPSRVDVVDRGGEPSRVITTDDLAQPVPDGTNGGGTRAPDGNDSSGLNSGNLVNPGAEGNVAPTTGGLDDDPAVPEVDRDREDPATTERAGAHKADDSEPDLGRRPAVNLTAPADLRPTTGPITASVFAADAEPGDRDPEPSRLTADDVPTGAGIGGRVSIDDRTPTSDLLDAATTTPGTLDGVEGDAPDPTSRPTPTDVPDDATTKGVDTDATSAGVLDSLADPDLLDTTPPEVQVDPSIGVSDGVAPADGFLSALTDPGPLPEMVTSRQFMRRAGRTHGPDRSGGGPPEPVKDEDFARSSGEAEEGSDGEGEGEPEEIPPTTAPTPAPPTGVSRPEPDGSFISRAAAEEVAQDLGATRAPISRIDPSDLDLIETGPVDEARLIRSSDLAQPSPDDPVVVGEEPQDDASSSTGRAGTGAIDPGPEAETTVSTAGPGLDVAVPDLDALADGEGDTVNAFDDALALPDVEEPPSRNELDVFDEPEDVKLNDLEVRDPDSDDNDTFFE